MPQYFSPWQALLQPAQPAAFPSPDVNDAMGFNVSPDDSAAVQFQKQYQAATFAATDEGKAMAVDVAKENLANKLAAALAERKAQLAQQYPELRSVVTTPMGTILGAMSNGDSKVLYQGSPEERAAAIAKIQAELATNVRNAKIASDPTVTQALIDKPSIDNKETQQRGNYYGAMPGLEQAKIDVDKARQKYLDQQAENAANGKPQTESQINETAFENAFPGMTMKGNDPASSLIKVQMGQNTPAGQALRDKFNQAKAELLKRRGSGMQAGNDALPDFSGALNLNLNGLQPNNGGVNQSNGLLGNQ